MNAGRIIAARATAPILARIERGRAFAAAHAGRYLRSAVQRRCPALQCLSSPAWALTRIVHQYRFGLTLAAPLQRVPRVASPAATIHWRRQIERVLVGAPRPAAASHEHAAQTLVRRFESTLALVRTHERVVTSSAARRATDPEAGRSGATEPAVAAPRARVEPALPVLPLARRAPAAAAANPAARAHAMPAAPQARAAARASTAVPMAEHEFERLADRLIGSLDRRLVAQRERLGRF